MFLPDPYAQPNPRRRRMLWVGLIVFVLLAAGAQPAYRAFRSWRARQLLEQAETFITQGNWTNAFARAQASFQLNSKNDQTVRALARILTHAGHDQGILYWQSLEHRSGLTPEDRKQMIALELLHKRYDLARTPLDEALKAKNPDTDILRLAAEFAQGTGDYGRALAFARAALAKDPENKRLELFEGSLLLSSRNDLDIQEGKRICWRILEGKDSAVALQAAEVLSGFPDLSASELDLLYKKLESLPNRGIREDFLAADLQWRRHPEQRSLYVAQMITQYQRSGNEGLRALGRWLNQHGSQSKTLDAIPLEEALKDRDLLLIYLDALSALNRWAEVDKILTNEKTQLEPILLELFKARAARELGQDKASLLYWGRVLELANDQPQWLLYVGDYAEKSGDLEHAEKAYRRLSQLPRSSRPAYAALIRIAERRGNTAELRNVLQDMTREFPDDLAPKNDLIYVNLLLNEDVVEGEQQSRRLLEKNPQSYAFRTTLALALLRLNRVSDAKALYEQAPIDWANALPSWQAVYVAVTGVTGQKNTAKALAKLINAQRLKPEERELVSRYLI